LKKFVLRKQVSFRKRVRIAAEGTDLWKNVWKFQLGHFQQKKYLLRTLPRPSFVKPFPSFKALQKSGKG